MATNQQDGWNALGQILHKQTALMDQRYNRVVERLKLRIIARSGVTITKSAWQSVVIDRMNESLPKLRHELQNMRKEMRDETGDANV